MSDEARELERLRAETARLAADAVALRAALAESHVALGESQASLDQTRAALAESHVTLAETRAALDEARAVIADLRRQLFGVKADRLTPAQETQLLALQQDVVDAIERPGPVSDEVLADERRGHPRRRRPPHGVPVAIETETITLEPEATTCPCCGEALRRIGEEVTEETDLVPAKLIRRRIVRPKYACRCGEAGVAIAPLPPRLIPQSTLGLGLAVHILLTRYDDHLSFYRLEQQFAERRGVRVPRQQMVQWVEHLAGWLRPIYDAMWRDVLASGYAQVDETPVRVLDPDVTGKAPRGYLWFYAAPRGDVLLEFDRRRSLAPVQQRLQHFTGTIQTDAYEVYQALVRQRPDIPRPGCLAHARRRFYAALRENLPEAGWVIGQIRALYQIEDTVRDQPAEVRHARRQQDAPARWAALKAKAEALQPSVLPKSTMGKAVSYFLDEYDALIGYLRDGRFEIDNNLIENDIRPTAVGRKRWLFIGHPHAGLRSAVISSIIVSRRRRGINPETYLTDVLRRLPSLKITEIEALLPAHWHPPG
jgi:transposase